MPVTPVSKTSGTPPLGDRTVPDEGVDAGIEVPKRPDVAQQSADTSVDNPLLGPVGDWLDVRGDAAVQKIESTRPAQALSKATRATIGPVANFLGKNFGRGLIAIGQAVDKASKAAVKKGEAMQVKGVSALESARLAADQLRKSAEDLRTWTQSPPKDATDEEVTQAKASLHAFETLAQRMDQMVRDPEDRKKLIFGQPIVFEALAAGVELTGKLSHIKDKFAGTTLAFAGKVAGWLLGSNTLTNTAVNVTGGVRVNVGTTAVNGGVHAAVLFPSVAMSEKAGSTYDAMYFTYGGGADTSVASVGYDRRGKSGAGINLFFIKGSWNDLTESIFVGIPGVFGINMGRDVERGSYTSVGLPFPFAGGPGLGAFGALSVALYTPILDPMNKYITRPVAKTIAKATERIADGGKRLWAWVKGDRVEHSPTAPEPFPA